MISFVVTKEGKYWSTNSSKVKPEWVSDIFGAYHFDQYSLSLAYNLADELGASVRFHVLRVG